MANCAAGVETSKNKTDNKHGNKNYHFKNQRRNKPKQIIFDQRQ